MSQSMRSKDSHLCFPKLVDEIEILLPVKFRRIPFSGYRENVENILSQSDDRAAVFVF